RCWLDLFLSFTTRFGKVSSFPANQFALANRHHQGVNPVVAEGATEHRSEQGFKSDRVVRDQESSAYQPRNDQLIALAIDFLFAVEKTKRNFLESRQVFNRVAVNQLDHICDAGR